MISILTAAFEQNPRFQAVIKKNNPARSVRHMTEFAYHLIDRVRKLYHYVGFEEYHRWEEEGSGITVWFLERKVHPPQRTVGKK